MVCRLEYIIKINFTGFFFSVTTRKYKITLVASTCGYVIFLWDNTSLAGYRGSPGWWD